MRGIPGLSGTGLSSLGRLEKRWGESRRGEREEIEADEEDLIQRAADEQYSLGSTLASPTQYPAPKSHLAIIIPIQKPAPTSLNLLMTLAGPAHAQRRIHMHIVARHIDRDQALE